VKQVYDGRPPLLKASAILSLGSVIQIQEGVIQIVWCVILQANKSGGASALTMIFAFLVY
jgi:hypothetical protein